MKLLGIDWLLTYSCDRTCPHCFFDTKDGGPVLPAALVDRALGDRALAAGMFFQHVSGGEPSLHTRELVELVQALRRCDAGEIGISTNGRWAVDDREARQWVAVMADAGVTGISVSLDGLHGAPDSEARRRAERASRAVRIAGLGRHSWLMACRTPGAESGARPMERPKREQELVALPLANVSIRPIGRGSLFLRGFASPGIPSAPCTRLSECLGERTPFEPAMVWIDPYGNVSICYGLVIGKLGESSLGEIVSAYRPDMNPVLAALSSGGPARLLELAESLGLGSAVEAKAGFVDECDLCWRVRKALRPVFPAVLGPAECYPEERVQAGTVP
ncbi:MAG: radical SAM protein [Spirochaetales bacterium]|nr:radical SAM protein [Spirochaetales bacterium]